VPVRPLFPLTSRLGKRRPECRVGIPRLCEGAGASGVALIGRFTGRHPAHYLDIRHHDGRSEARPRRGPAQAMLTYMNDKGAEGARQADAVPRRACRRLRCCNRAVGASLGPCDLDAQGDVFGLCAVGAGDAGRKETLGRRSRHVITKKGA
jgi:hypothetical protein